MSYLKPESSYRKNLGIMGWDYGWYEEFIFNWIDEKGNLKGEYLNIYYN